MHCQYYARLQSTNVNKARSLSGALSFSSIFTLQQVFVLIRYINMDRTALFKATVKTIRTKNKALGVKEATRDILGSKRQKSEFGTRAKDVVRCDIQVYFVSAHSIRVHVQVINFQNLR